MSLNFQNIATLSIQQQSRFFQAGFNYANSKSISIQGLLTDLTNSFGVTGIWTGIDITNKAAIDYQPLIINGVNFGSGRIVNINYDQGNDVRLKKYSATIEVLDSGNMFNLTGTHYDGINLYNSQYLQDFDENWSFQRQSNGGYSSNHSALIRFSTGVGNINAIETAKTLAKTLFTGSNLGFAFYSGYSNKQGKRFFTESYNLINKSCSFGETFDFNSDDGNYSAIRTHSVSLDQQGIVSATEAGTIAGIENINYQKALAALNIEMTGTYFRCSGVAFNYFPSGAVLINSPLGQSRTFDLFSNNLSYQIGYSNNPNNSGTYFWDYTQQVTRDNGIGIITENGTILGRGKNKTTAFASAQNGLTTTLAGLPTRITSSFLSIFGSSTNYLQSKDQAFAPFEGKTSYSYQYSNDPALISNNGVRRVEVTKSKVPPIYSYNKLNIFNYKEIIQDDKQSTVGSTTINVNLQGDKSVGLQGFLPVAVAQINANAPTGNNRYIGAVSYSYDRNQNTVDASLSWIYNAAAGKTTFPE